LEKKEYSFANHYFLQALNIRKSIKDFQGQAQVLNNIGKNEVFKGSFKLASGYFTDALMLSRKIGSKESALISLQSLSSVYDTLGDYKKALIYFKQFKNLNDSIYNIENNLIIEKLENEHKNADEKKYSN
jgi:tetratricopeptide (TPR) repeat protein